MEQASWNLARALAREGADVTLLTTAVDHRAHVWEEDGISVHAIEYVPQRLRSKPRYRWWAYFAPAAARYARTLGLVSDVIHSQSLYASGFLRAHPRPPVVVTLHGTPMGDYLGATREKLIQEVGPYHPRRLLQWAAVRWSTCQAVSILREVDAIVAVSAVVAGMAPGVPSDDPRLSVIPNGIDPERFPWMERSSARTSLGLPGDATILSFLGRLEEYKGVGRLLDILPQIPEAHLLLAGEGSYSDAARRRARDPSIQDRVHVLGDIPDHQRPALLAASDLVCLPSQMEGQPVSLLEALAMGTPIATTRPWLPDELLPFAIVDNDLERMLKAGLALSRTFDRRRAREIVFKSFAWDRIARRYLDLFERLGSSKRTVAAPMVDGAR